MHTNKTKHESSSLHSPDGVRAGTLARVNFGLFRELRERGTPREKICATLCLNRNEYDYLARLG